MKIFKNGNIRLEKHERITVKVNKWFDKINGNTYHSIKIYLNDRYLKSGFTYGYGDSYKQTILKLLGNIKINNEPIKHNNIHKFINEDIKQVKKKDINIF